MISRFVPTVVLAVVWFGPERACAQMTFNVTNGGSATAQMMTGFQQAAALWSGVLHDPITINVKVNAAALSVGQIGGTSAFFDRYSYADTRNALLNDRTSTADFSATNALQGGPNFSMLINRTANSPTGVVSATPYFDNGLGGPGQAGPENNNTVRITSANAKALGLLPGNLAGSDGTITFSTSVSFDYDRSNGIGAGQIDFVGVAAHEMGHLLGFISGVEVLDGNGAAPGLNDNQLQFVTPLDLFRFSSRSTGTGGGVGVIDWTADGATKYFSIDGGLTSLATFETGSTYGSGREAHHWRDNQGFGIMDPTASSGTLLNILALDVNAFDVIGYNTAVPEPRSSVALCFAAVALVTIVQRRRALRGPVPYTS